MFDRDAHERFNEAVDRAYGLGFELAVSNPCVELWLLLHFRDSPGAQHRNTLQRMMCDHVDGYDKSLRFEDFEERVDDATARARRLDAAAEARGDPRFGNPSTGFYRLTESIKRRD